MNAIDDQVGKLIEPIPVTFTFATPGWYVVGILLLLLLAGLIVLLIKYYQQNRYRKQALLLLLSTEKKYTDIQAFDLLVYEAYMLTKRIAMSLYGRQNVAGLRQSQWIEFINSTWRKKSFDANDEILLDQTIYQPEKLISADNALGFTNKVKQWIKTHKRHAHAV